MGLIEKFELADARFQLQEEGGERTVFSDRPLDMQLKPPATLAGNFWSILQNFYFEIHPYVKQIFMNP